MSFKDLLRQYPRQAFLHFPPLCPNPCGYPLILFAFLFTLELLEEDHVDQMKDRFNQYRNKYGLSVTRDIFFNK